MFFCKLTIKKFKLILRINIFKTFFYKTIKFIKDTTKLAIEFIELVEKIIAFINKFIKFASKIKKRRTKT